MSSATNLAFRAINDLAQSVASHPVEQFPPVVVPADAPAHLYAQLRAIDREATETARAILAEAPTVPELWERVAAHERAGEWWLMDENTGLAQRLALDARLEAVRFMHARPGRVANFPFFLNRYEGLLREQAEARKAVRR